MRCGLFLTVCTPSGVRVEIIMNVGMFLHSWSGGAVIGDGWPPYRFDVPMLVVEAVIHLGPPGRGSFPDFCSALAGRGAYEAPSALPLCLAVMVLALLIGSGRARRVWGAMAAQERASFEIKSLQRRGQEPFDYSFAALCKTCESRRRGITDLEHRLGRREVY